MPNSDKLDQLHDRLLAQTEALMQSQGWQDFLAMAARFHRYSTGVGGISEVRELEPGKGVLGDRGKPGDRLVRTASLDITATPSVVTPSPSASRR